MTQVESVSTRFLFGQARACRTYIFARSSVYAGRRRGGYGAPSAEDMRTGVCRSLRRPRKA